MFTDRVFFPKGPPEKRTHHLSLVVSDSAGWHDPIKFRDYLRTHAETRAAYQTLKETLAAQYPNDRPSYTKAKDTMIKDILSRTS